jgi:SAM-dependent methyltransferase
VLEFGDERFDVVVSLEVLSHVEDQRAFVTKLHRLLKPGGHLLLSTQNRPVLERFNRIPPPEPGQLRRWVDRAELRDLLTPQFEVLRLTSVTPRADRGVMRVITSRKLQRAVRPLVGDRLERSLEHLGLGWTLMAVARRPSG